MKTKNKANTFIFFFWKRFKTNNKRIKWKIIQDGEENIADVIISKVTLTTHRRVKNPRAVMKGKGIIRYERFKQDGFKKVKAIIE